MGNNTHINNCEQPDDGRDWSEVVSVIDGMDVISAFGVEILTGCDRANIMGASDQQVGALRSGRRRAREAMAHTGQDDIFTGLAYWADREGYDVTGINSRPIFAAKKVSA